MIFDKSVKKVSDYPFPRITRERLKIVDADSTETGDGTNSLPTAEEKAWQEIMTSKAPELEKLRKKIYVCYIADVVQYSPDAVTIAYDGKNYTIKKPANSLRIAYALEKSKLSALNELNEQHCIVVGNPEGMLYTPKDFMGVDVEVINILRDVADNFFFTPYL